MSLTIPSPIEFSPRIVCPTSKEVEINKKEEAKKKLEHILHKITEKKRDREKEEKKNRQREKETENKKRKRERRKRKEKSYFLPNIEREISVPTQK